MTDDDVDSSGGRSPLREFLATESAGAAFIAVAAVIALVWANSPWRESYESLWSTRLSVSLGGHSIDLDLRHWVNDGLMTIFFLLVGLEINRELTDGHFATPRRALAPVAAALGGMALPALVYLAIAGATAPRGWAIPMSTDIALAIGLLTALGRRVPAPARALALGLAVVDDIGAIVVIAIVFSTGVAVGWLFTAAGLILVALVLRRVVPRSTVPFVVIGVALWIALYESGVHPTLAGVAMGLLAPAVPRWGPDELDTEELLDLSDVDHARASAHIARGSVSTVAWLEHQLHPFSSFVVVPVFALANAGIELSVTQFKDALTSPVAWGVLAGLVVGKPIGVMLASRLAVRARIADAPEGTSKRQLLGVGQAAGIGFTVALFVTELAFHDPAHENDAKLAILVGSVVAAALAALILARRSVDTIHDPARSPL